MASTSSAQDLESQLPTILGSEVVNTTDEDDFQQTLELLQIDTEELSNEISHSAEEVSHSVVSISFTIVVRCVEYNLFILYSF